MVDSKGDIENHTETADVFTVSLSTSSRTQSEVIGDSPCTFDILTNCDHFSENKNYSTNTADSMTDSINLQETVKDSVDTSDNVGSVMSGSVHTHETVKDYVDTHEIVKVSVDTSDNVGSVMRGSVQTHEIVKNSVDTSDNVGSVMKGSVHTHAIVKDSVDTSDNVSPDNTPESLKNSVIKPENTKFSVNISDSVSGSHTLESLKDCIIKPENAKFSVNISNCVSGSHNTLESLKDCIIKPENAKFSVNISDSVSGSHNTLESLKDCIIKPENAKFSVNISNCVSGSVNTAMKINANEIIQPAALKTDTVDASIHTTLKSVHELHNTSVTVQNSLHILETAKDYFLVPKNVDKFKKKPKNINQEYDSNSQRKQPPTFVKDVERERNVGRSDPAVPHGYLNNKTKAQTVIVNKKPVRSTKPAISQFSVSDTPLLSDVFQFFRIPRMLSPLPSSPPPSHESKDLSLVSFQSGVPKDIPIVAPQKRLDGEATIHKTGSLSLQMFEARKMLAKRKAAVQVKPKFRTNDSTTVNDGVKVNGSATVNGSRQKRGADNTEMCSTGPIKKQKISNITGFSNPFSAVMHDLRHFLAADHGNVRATVASILTWSEENNAIAAWALFCQVVVKYIESTQEEDVFSSLLSACQEREIVDNVFLRKDEKQLVHLISTFLTVHTGLDQRLLMGTLWMIIFNRDCTNQLVRMSYCRIFVGLCMEQGDLEQARILVYNIAWCNYLDLVHLLIAIVGVWPDVLSHSYIVSKSCVWKVLKFMLKDKCKHDNILYEKVCLIMQRICLVDLEKAEDRPEKLLKTLLEQLMNRVQNGISDSSIDKSFETMKAVELLLVYQDPTWTEDHFFKRTLVSFAMRWENKGLKKSGPTDQFVTCLIKIFRAVIAVQPLSSSAVLTVLGTVFPRFIKEDAGDTSLELACIDAILELTPLNPEKCLDLLKKWQTNKKGNIPPEIFSKLQQAQSFVSQKCQLGKRQNKKRKFVKSLK